MYIFLRSMQIGVWGRVRSPADPDEVGRAKYTKTGYVSPPKTRVPRPMLGGGVPFSRCAFKTYRDLRSRYKTPFPDSLFARSRNRAARVTMGVIFYERIALRLGAHGPYFTR